MTASLISDTSLFSKGTANRNKLSIMLGEGGCTKIKNLNAKNPSIYATNFPPNTQILNICKSSFYYLYNIRNIRAFLDQTSCAALIHAFITCRFDYCNGLYYGLPAYQIAKLERIQNAAARLVCSTPRFSHITPALADLHWLPVKFRVLFKILPLTFRAIHGLAPKYMTGLIAIKNHSCYNELLLAHPPNKLKPTLGAKTFTYAAPTEWNSAINHKKHYCI